MRPDILVEVISSDYCRLHFRLNLMHLVDLMTLMDLTLMDMTTLLTLFSCNSCLTHLLVILHSGHLGESSLAEFTAVRLFPCVTSHVTLQAGGLKESFTTLVAEVGPFVVMLFPV